MSREKYIPIQNNIRFDLSLTTYREKQFVLYRIQIVDLAIGIRYEAKFRFSQIKKIHEEMLKKYQSLKDVFPELPRTNSFCFWNRTNNDHRKIQERRRELEFYLDRIVNNNTLRVLPEIKGFLINGSKVVTRTHSNIDAESEFGRERRGRSLPSAKEKILACR